MTSEGGTAISTLDELACLESMRRGDPTCLGGFFDAWADRLYGLSLRLTGDPAAAEDVVQESFVKLMAGADRIEGRSRLATWLYRVAYNASMDRLREQKKLVPVPADEDDEAAQPMPTTLVEFGRSPEAMLRDAETRHALDEAPTARPPSAGRHCRTAGTGSRRRRRRRVQKAACARHRAPGAGFRLRGRGRVRR